MSQIEDMFNTPYGVGEYPEKFFDWFNWGAFAMAPVWAVMYRSWAVLSVYMLSLLLPILVTEFPGMSDSSSAQVYFGVGALMQIVQIAAALWIGMNANRFAWKAESVRVAAIGQGRARWTFGQYLAKQRTWARVTIGLTLVALVSIPYVYTSPEYAQFVTIPAGWEVYLTIDAIAWNIVALLGAFYIAHQGTIFSDPLIWFSYRPGKAAMDIASVKKFIDSRSSDLGDVEALKKDSARVMEKVLVFDLKGKGSADGEGSGRSEIAGRSHTTAEPTGTVASNDDGKDTVNDISGSTFKSNGLTLSAGTSVVSINGEKIQATEYPDDIYTYALANEVEIPVLGFGTYKIAPGDDTVKAVKLALKAGYRHIDTASFYQNETAIARAIKLSSLNREDIFITSKVWNDQQGYMKTITACEQTLANLETDYLDLFLVHWPVEKKLKATWRALEHLYIAKKVRAIGVCNFEEQHLELLLKHANIVPMVNQIELHPRFTRKELVAFCDERNILVQAWAPLMRGGVIEIPELTQLGQKYGKSEAQIALRWHLQNGMCVLPKSVTPGRIRENFEIFDFELSDEDMAIIDSLDRGLRIGPDPAKYSWEL